MVGTIGPATYAAWRQTALGRITEALEHRLIVDFAADVAGARVLDAGCGDGLLACSLAERGAHSVGLDADRRMLVAAAARAGGRGVHATFVEGRVERVPFADDVFDVVVAVTVLCFVSDASVAVREIARVLRPGGRLVIGELGRWNTWAARRRVRGWLGSPCGRPRNSGRQPPCARSSSRRASQSSRFAAPSTIRRSAGLRGLWLRSIDVSAT